MRNKLGFFVMTLFSAAILFYACRHQVLTQETTNTGSGSGSGTGSGTGNGTGSGTGSGTGTGGGGAVVPPPASTCSPDTVYFASAILPIIVSNCAKSGCHDATSHVEGLNLTTYSAISKMVSPGNATGSRLYSVIKGGSMPPKSSGSVSAAQLALIQTWINQGALNNSCSGGCDTTIYTFSGAVNPTLQTYCVGCHNSTTTSGSVNLSTYAGVQTVAANGQLVGSLLGTLPAPYAQMPLGGNPLATCQITQIQKWIAAGAPNN